MRFGNLFKKKRRPLAPPIEQSLSDGYRLYAIGDIHGRADLLKLLHEKIAKDAETSSPDLKKILVYLGDYVDRGMHSKSVLDELLHNTLPPFKKVFLKGNHEEAMLTFLEDATFGAKWFSVGGSATIASYGIGVPAGLTAEQRTEHIWHELQDKLPAEHLVFLKSLHLSFEMGDYFFAHAGIKPGVALDQQKPKDLLWIRDEFLKTKSFGGKTIVHGHSLRKNPDIQEYRIGIDTGAYATHKLTCLILEGTTRRLLQT